MGKQEEKNAYSVEKKINSSTFSLDKPLYVKTGSSVFLSALAENWFISFPLNHQFKFKDCWQRFTGFATTMVYTYS